MGDRSADRPDGIGRRHEAAPAGMRRHAVVVPLVILSLVMLFALLGFAGLERTISATENGTSVEWHSPQRIRNGEFFEIRLSVAADRRLSDLTVEIPQPLWEDFTINTFIPAPAEETGEDGIFSFSFGPLETGTEFVMKVDAQINPDMLGGNAGEVVILDGDERLVSLPVSIELLP